MALSLVDSYLILYNISCCAGWAWILSLALPSIFSSLLSSPFDIKDALASVYGIEGLAKTLTIVQSAAMLEIAHAGLGFVRSPLFVTAMQVGSRIIALYAVTHSPESQGTYACDRHPVFLHVHFTFVFQ